MKNYASQNYLISSQFTCIHRHTKLSLALWGNNSTRTNVLDNVTTALSASSFSFNRKQRGHCFIHMSNLYCDSSESIFLFSFRNACSKMTTYHFSPIFKNIFNQSHILCLRTRLFFFFWRWANRETSFWN